MSPDITTTTTINTTTDHPHKHPPTTLNHPPPLLKPSTSQTHNRKSPKKSKKSRKNSPKPIKVITKCYSEPIIFEPIGDCRSLVGGSRSFNTDEAGSLSRFNTLDAIFSCSPEIIDSPISRINAGYEKESKVVITVTVEGSPGPIRILVKLGTNVEEAIKLVIQKYEEEGRTPYLDKDSTHCDFDLHVSYFSLECLERSDTIGDAGTRSFYLRKTKRCYEGNNTETMPPTTEVFPLFSAPKMNKFERRFLRLLKILGCLNAK